MFSCIIVRMVKIGKMCLLNYSTAGNSPAVVVFRGSRRQSFWTSSMRNHLQQIEQRIFVVRNQQVIMDRDLAALYEVETSQLNRQVKRNIQRFPEDFMFQLTKEEVESLKCQNGISKSRGGDRCLPYVFTEQGVSMLSGLLRSETAMQVNILIMRAFVAMRRFSFSYEGIYTGRTP